MPWRPSIFSKRYSGMQSAYLVVSSIAKALHAIGQQAGVNIWNLGTGTGTGTGTGYSVLQMIRAFEQASGQPVPYQVVERRPGDIAECWADPAKAARELGWQAERGLAAMMVDTWRWQSGNPQGYGG